MSLDGLGIMKVVASTVTNMRPSGQRFDLDILRQFATIVAILGGIAINAWSNLYPPNGLNVGQISSTLFASVQIIPANYAFAIWGLIYLGLVAFGVYQLLPAQRHNPSLQRGGWLLVMASIAQAAWIYLFLARLFPLSVLAMGGILLPLIGLYLHLRRPQQRVSSRERWLVHYPISLYLGWITVATVVNVAIALFSLNWNGWGLPPQGWTALMVVVSTAIAAWMTLQRHDIVFALVIIWALVAIAVRQMSLPLVWVTAVVMAAILALLIVRTQLNRQI
jgi:hypothetical protein